MKNLIYIKTWEHIPMIVASTALPIHINFGSENLQRQERERGMFVNLYFGIARYSKHEFFQLE